MDKLIEFIKKFDPSQFDYKWSQILICFALIIIGLIIVNWIINYLSINTAKFIKAIFRWTFMTILYGFTILILLNSLLTKHYGTLIFVIAILISNGIDKWLKRYDNYIDKKFDRKTDIKKQPPTEHIFIGF